MHVNPSPKHLSKISITVQTSYTHARQAHLVLSIKAGRTSWSLVSSNLAAAVCSVQDTTHSSISNSAQQVKYGYNSSLHVSEK